MGTDNKKAVSTTLTAFLNSQTPSHHNMTVSNKEAPCLEPSIITNRLVLLSAGGYSESTTLNHVVRRETLIYNFYGVQRTSKTCAFFVSVLWWRCTCWLFVICTVEANRSGLNLCNVTALTRETVSSGDLHKLYGDTKMSINTPITPSSEVRYV